MTGLALSPSVTQAQLDSCMPQPATSAPPSVADTSATGSAVPYARADHTHRSSMQAQRMTAALTAGKFTWTFPAPYEAGVVPVVNVTAESPDPSGGYVLDARVVAGSVTNTGCQIMVNRISASQTLAGSALALLGQVLSIIAPGTGTAVVHCWARKP